MVVNPIVSIIFLPWLIILGAGLVVMPLGLLLLVKRCGVTEAKNKVETCGGAVPLVPQSLVFFAL